MKDNGSTMNEGLAFGEGGQGMLAGIKVLDISRVFAGPLTGQWLADFGADVIKIEQPGRGDDCRRLPPFIQQDNGRDDKISAPFISLNRNKRSVTLDFTKPEGYEILLGLVREADVLIENFKAGSLKKYGVDYETLKEVNPGLIYCSITGFGQTGPYKDRPGYDLIFQAMSGLMSLTGHADSEPGGGPMRVGYSMVDINTGTAAALGIVSALFHRMRSGDGKGQYIDVALLDSQIFSLTHMAMTYLVSGDVPKRTGNKSYTGAPVQSIDCKDFKIVVSVGNNQQWANMCRVLGVDALAEDPRFVAHHLRVQNRDAMMEIIEPIFLTKNAAEWVELLNGVGVPVGPLYDLEQVFQDEQVRHRGVQKTITHETAGEMPTLANPLKFSETPVRYVSAPPLQGEHTEEVLGDVLGLDPDTIAAYRKAGII